MKGIGMETTTPMEENGKGEEEKEKGIKTKTWTTDRKTWIQGKTDNRNKMQTNETCNKDIKWMKAGTDKENNQCS